MSKTKKAGIILILLGIGLPLISLPFASKYDPRSDLIGNIQEMEIVIEKSKALKYGEPRKDIVAAVKKLLNQSFSEGDNKEIENIPDVLVRFYIWKAENTLRDQGFPEEDIRGGLKGYVEELRAAGKIKKAKVIERILKDEETVLITYVIPYKYFFASGIILVLTGIGLIVLSKEAVKK
ncbi:MAG: hypothetical protein ACUVUQ_07710 [Thermodesulfovibrionales bacterium]